MSLRANNVSEAIQPSRELCCKAGSPRRLWLLAMTIAFMMGGYAVAAESTETPAKEVMTAKYDTKLPVEISADNLEVLQKESKAIFKGSVIAVQGKLRLNADKMVVHYKQKTEAEKAAKPTEATTTEGMGAVSLIEVEGNVLVATPEETARGDKGDYEVDKRFLRLTGENVILTRDKNILRGKSVEYDLDTGRSVLTNKNGEASTKGDNRVRGVFVPKSEEKPAKKP